jgi:gliding motility-associated-like protein
MREHLKFLCRALVLALALATSATAGATHLVGGEMYYTYLGDNIYEFHLIIYRDCGPTNTNGTDFDFIAPIGVYSPSGVFNVSTTVQLFNSDIEEIDLQSSSACAVLPPEICLERGEYTFELTLPPSAEGYTVVYQRCCRNPQILNLIEPISTGFTIFTSIPGTATTGAENWGNSSPEFTTLPQAYVCQNHPFTLDNPAIDPNGDSLSYSLCPIYLGGTYTAPSPNPPTGPPFTEVTWETGFSPGNPFGPAPISIDPLTGTLSGTPDLVGKYAIGVCISEFRDGVFLGRTLRDFTIDVVPCEILIPSVSPPEPCSGLTSTFVIEQSEGSFQWNFGPASILDSSEYQPVVIFPSEGQFTVGFSYQLGDCADSTSFEVTVVVPREPAFTWSEPICDHFGYDIEFEYTGDDPEPGSMSWWIGGEQEGVPVVDPANFALATNLSPGIHEIEAQIEVLGCTFSVMHELDLPALPVAAFTPGEPPCNGLSVPFDNLSSGSTSFHWTFNVLDASTGAAAESFQQAPTWNYAGYGSYTARLVADPDRLCADTAYFDVVVLPENPLVMAMTYREPPACSLETHGEFAFLGQNADLVEWDFGPFGVAFGDSAWADFVDSGTYPVTLTIYNDTCATQLSGTFDFSVPPMYSAVELVIPNVLTPNADGKNDRFRVALQPTDGSPIVGAAADQFSHYALDIYNRWGVLIYSAQQYGAGWDGSIGGSPGSAGTYYFILDADHVCTTKRTLKQGQLTLLRD